MFVWLNSWRLKRRQHALAMAWCGERRLANQLLEESRTGMPRLGSVAVYRHMADCWLRLVDDGGALPNCRQDEHLYRSGSTHDPLSHRVRRLISQMPMAQRMTLSLVDVARLSYSETAAVMNIGLFDVQYHVVTARCCLLEEMQPNIAQSLGPTETAGPC